MLSPRPSLADIQAAGAARANLVRYPLNPFVSTDAWTPAQYRAWVLSEASILDTLLPLFQQHGMRVVLDLHIFPRNGTGVHKLFRERAWTNEFLAVWDLLGAHYANNPVIYALDLLNEPNFADNEQEEWEKLATSAIERIRKHDADRVVVFEPKRAEPGRFRGLSRLKPRRALYSLHMYNPLSLTHQGINGYAPGVPYPGADGSGRKIDKTYLRSILQAAKDFADANDAGIYVGEFSFNQSSPVPSAYNYLRDVTSLFEEFKWRWTYHAWREAPYWNVEAGADNTASFNLLKTHFQKNP